MTMKSLYVYDYFCVVSELNMCSPVFIIIELLIIKDYLDARSSTLLSVKFKTLIFTACQLFVPGNREFTA